jgi:AcrR family transcriptional regulator
MSDMGRTTDPMLKVDLLAAVVDYVSETGLADLSLRPLATAIGSSPRTLLYHFGSKDRLIAAILDEARRRQRALLDAWQARSAEHDARTLLLRGWQWLAAARHDRVFRLFFEVYGLGLRDRKRHAAFLRGSTSDWNAPFRRALEAHGFSRERAGGLATLVVAVIRGLLLESLATGDRDRAERAFRSFIYAIELPEGRPERS